MIQTAGSRSKSEITFTVTRREWRERGTWTKSYLLTGKGRGVSAADDRGERLLEVGMVAMEPFGVGLGWNHALAARPSACRTGTRRQLAPALQPTVWSNVFDSVPMPSIEISMRFDASFMTPTPTDVPQQMTSPGSSVMSCEMRATISAGG